MLPWRERFHPPAEAGKSIPISIHAPAKGATYPCRCRHCAYIISIHAPAWGATEVQKWLDIQKHYFNPRSRMGSDNTGRISCTHHQNFNPRSREGSDQAGAQELFPVHPISIHAPAKGATRILDYCVNNGLISIHAPAKGATKVFLEKDGDRRISIHAPAKGATEE